MCCGACSGCAAGAHLDTAVKRFQLSRRSTGSTGDQAATVALMHEFSTISAMMRHHARKDTTDWKPVTASAARTEEPLRLARILTMPRKQSGRTVLPMCNNFLKEEQHLYQQSYHWQRLKAHHLEHIIWKAEVLTSHELLRRSITAHGGLRTVPQHCRTLRHLQQGTDQITCPACVSACIPVI